ncbi:zinc fingers and homeoboxes protein 3-like [Anguilla anguilla]|uniref:zinc fingers and homeoboxes protein 3-like n=1 Tax=Anguilla anguilla TaxID=7936 RepID=UPI0015B03405|nr:zinc fingers and homeoboxes protein 3-like [Anguilla anguilla]XP_035242906.1 zinc fingers and homeoboxes protein 3-like [Anguilla anguilla]
MASKRKSTIPCMIPPKTTRPPQDRDSSPTDPPPPTTKNGASREGREEEEEAIPAAVTTIVRVPGSKECSQSSWPEEDAVSQQGGDSYTCPPCRFESRDLNLFLDHVYSGHPEFRADPTFHCTNCGVSCPKFEGLALHNARAHPTLGAAGSPTSAALQVRRQERRIRVEQSLITGEGTREAEISITKTPIMKRLRGKSEHKRIVVSHMGAAEEPGPEVGRKDPQMTMPPPAILTSPTSVTHNGTVPKALPPLPSAIQIVNGSSALPLLKTAISQVVTVVQNRTPHQSAPITVSSSSSSSSSSPSSRNLPKVMIPLSSIPTYNAAMDSSSFLKTSFSKFPYPTKAELCYLTVVTKYPEEQIKIWFTAQRLKQGISWSPEEIEDSRRKMFNTIIQAPSAGQSQSPQARHTHQGPSHHTITVLPTALGSGGVPHILQGSLVGQGGMIVTQPMITNGLQVSSAPVTLAVTPRPQPRPQTQARPATAVGADKSGAVGSSSRVPGSAVTSGNSITSSNSLNSIITSSICSNSTSNGSTSNSSTGSGSASNNTSNASKASENTATSKSNGDGCSKTGDSAAMVPAAPILRGAPSSRTLPSSFLDPSFYKSKKSAEQLGTLKQSFVRCEFPGQDEVERLTKLTGLTVREVRKWFSDRRYHNRNLKGPRSSTGGVPFTGGTLLDLTDSPSSSGSPQSPLATATVATASAARRAPPSQMADFTAVRYKERDPQQVRALEASYALDPLPSTEEVDRLRAETKMTRREIDGWFSERRKRATPKSKSGEGEQEEEEDEEEDDDDGGEGKSDPDDPLLGTSSQQCTKENELKVNPKVNPIKINLKMLKVTKPEPESGAHSERESDSPKSPPPFTSSRGKKTAEQLHLLRQVFARTHWPSSLQYDQLIARTGLPRPEVVRWFGDSRYVYKNGQLKWLESYQRAAAAEEKEGEEKNDKEEEEGEEEGKGDTTAPKDRGKPNKEEAPGAEGLVESSRPGTEGRSQRVHQAQESRRAEEEEEELEEEEEQDQGAVKKEGEQARSSPACEEGEKGSASVPVVQFAKPSPNGSSRDGSPGKARPPEPEPRAESYGL